MSLLNDSLAKGIKYEPLDPAANVHETERK